MSGKKEMSEEDYLKQHLIQNESQNQNRDMYQMIDSGPSNTRAADLQFVTVDIRQLPCGQFYPDGTTLLIRAAQVKEVQSYSMVDDANFHDVIEKMNDMLASCVRIKFPDGKMGSYLDIKDQDRLYLIFMIRELTFQNGTSLSVKTKCTCGENCELELKRFNFRFHQIDEKLKGFYNKKLSSFYFKTKNGKEFSLTPPTIGLQKAFTEYIIKENSEKKKPNMAFLKIIPFMLEGRSSITQEGIAAKLNEFESLDDISFQFLNSAVSKMTFGIKELVKNCGSCGLEVRADMQFPNGASGIFVIHDAFETFIEK
jgi:hypothetical protein